MNGVEQRHVQSVFRSHTNTAYTRRLNAPTKHRENIHQLYCSLAVLHPSQLIHYEIMLNGRACMRCLSASHTQSKLMCWPKGDDMMKTPCVYMCIYIQYNLMWMRCCSALKSLIPTTLGLTEQHQTLLYTCKRTSWPGTSFTYCIN